MSENGPREGTRDLPRSGPEAGRRAVDGSSASGAVYQAIARRTRRRHDEILEAVRSGLSPQEAATTYNRNHPLEREVTVTEVTAVVSASRLRPAPARAPSG